MLDEVLLDVLVLDVVLLVVLDPHSLQHDLLPLLVGMDALPFEDLCHGIVPRLRLLLIRVRRLALLGVGGDPAQVFYPALFHVGRNQGVLLVRLAVVVGLAGTAILIGVMQPDRVYTI